MKRETLEEGIYVTINCRNNQINRDYYDTTYYFCNAENGTQSGVETSVIIITPIIIKYTNLIYLRINNSILLSMPIFGQYYVVK